MGEDRASRQDVTRVAVCGDRAKAATSSDSLETESVSTESTFGFGSDDGGVARGECACERLVESLSRGEGRIRGASQKVSLERSDTRRLLASQGAVSCHSLCQVSTSPISLHPRKAFL